MQEAVFFGHGHAPDDNGAVFEEEDFGCVHCGVEVLIYDWLMGGVLHRGFFEGGGVVGGGCGCEIDQVFAADVLVFFDFERRVRVATLAVLR